MGKSLVQRLFPATTTTIRMMKEGEFKQEIDNFTDDCSCAGCRGFARARIYAYPIMSDAMRDGVVAGTIAAVGYRVYQAICG